MKNKYLSLKGFPIVFADLVALNLISLLLPLSSQIFYSHFIVGNILLWLLSYQISGRCFLNKKTWAITLTAATTCGYGLLIIFNLVMAYGGGGFQNVQLPLSFLLLFGFYLLICRLLLICTKQILADNPKMCRKIVVIGGNKTTSYLLRQFDRNGENYNLAGIFDDQLQIDKFKLPITGVVDDCINFAIDHQATEIYCTISPEKDSRIGRLAEIAERNFIQFKIVPDISYYLCKTRNLNHDIELPILCLTPEPEANLPGQIQKRIFDVLLSSFVIIFILSWLAPILAFLIKLESAGPIFFAQMRTGKNGRPFLCYKFRSLKVNNEADSQQVIANDHRFTRIGKFMRKTNFDELPQFFNVLLGDMSVVGSRPHMLKHTEDYSLLHTRYMVRHYIKPGLTGWAQVNGYRGEIKVADQLVKRVDHDIWYMENWNFWLDMRIVLQTVSSTFKGDKNAY